jgi:hypothetical protein
MPGGTAACALPAATAEPAASGPVPAVPRVKLAKIPSLTR